MFWLFLFASDTISIDYYYIFDSLLGFFILFDDRILYFSYLNLVNCCSISCCYYLNLAIFF